jgi:hypothetical protein
MAARTQEKRRRRRSHDVHETYRLIGDPLVVVVVLVRGRVAVERAPLVAAPIGSLRARRAARAFLGVGWAIDRAEGGDHCKSSTATQTP